MVLTVHTGCTTVSLLLTDFSRLLRLACASVFCFKIRMMLWVMMKRPIIKGPLTGFIQLDQITCTVVEGRLFQVSEVSKMNPGYQDCLSSGWKTPALQLEFKRDGNLPDRKNPTKYAAELHYGT